MPVDPAIFRAAPARMVAFLAFWLLLHGADAAGFVVGLAAAAGACAVSLRLLPGTSSPRIWALVALAPRFIIQSAMAGADVARRALSPRMALRPGFVAYHPLLPAGPGRSLFLAVSSLLPGTVPAGAGRDGTLAVHCLDTGLPVAAILATDEARMANALGHAANG